MAVRIKINEYGDCVYSENSVLELLYQNPDLDISKLYLDDLTRYKQAVKDLGIDLPEVMTHPERQDNIKEFDRRNTETWYMPADYQSIDVSEWLLKRCNSSEEKQRVIEEMQLFQKKGFVKVLQFLIYFIDVLRQNNVVWGVGRGSSVSSFCLFLIGVHKINPMEYDLDYREFLR